MPVEVRIPTVFSKFTDQQATVEVDGGPISSVISQLDERYPGFAKQLLGEDGQLHRFVNVYVNDEDIRYLEQLDTKASEGDVVSLLPSVAGGSEPRH